MVGKYAEPNRSVLALEREIHRHHAPPRSCPRAHAVLAHQFAPRFPRKSCDRAEDNYYPQPAAVAGAYCLTLPNDKKTVSLVIVTSRGNNCPRLL